MNSKAVKCYWLSVDDEDRAVCVDSAADVRIRCLVDGTWFLQHAIINRLCTPSNVCLYVVKFLSKISQKLIYESVQNLQQTLALCIILKTINFWCRSHSRWLTFSHFSFNRSDCCLWRLISTSLSAHLVETISLARLASKHQSLRIYNRGYTLSTNQCQFVAGRGISCLSTSSIRPSNKAMTTNCQHPQQKPHIASRDNMNIDELSANRLKWVHIGNKSC